MQDAGYKVKFLKRWNPETLKPWNIETLLCPLIPAPVFSPFLYVCFKNSSYLHIKKINFPQNLILKSEIMKKLILIAGIIMCMTITVSGQLTLEQTYNYSVGVVKQIGRASCRESG